MDTLKKLEILSSAAKYDVSCSSSGSKRQSSIGVGNAHYAGICHSWTDDGRCISLLKILMTNYCIYDCAYCYNRKSNDIQRATFTVDELVNLTIAFYKRNFIEGLFLSSAVIKSPDYTMERLLNIVKKLRTERSFFGYIHLKAIPGADKKLIHTAGLYADRMSINIELPTSKSLSLLASEKDYSQIMDNIGFIGTNVVAYREERKKDKKIPSFVPAGQSTQLIVGASEESDLTILNQSEKLYKSYNLKRVYYSAYCHVNNDNRLPAMIKPPLLREHRLYQADWLLRFYGFNTSEILSEESPNLDLDFDPKVCWALRNPGFFPVEINKADYQMLLRVPGIGLKSAKRIITARKFSLLRHEDLEKLGVVMKRARYFILCNGQACVQGKDKKMSSKGLIIHSRNQDNDNRQMRLF